MFVAAGHQDGEHHSAVSIQLSQDKNQQTDIDCGGPSLAGPGAKKGRTALAAGHAAPSHTAGWRYERLAVKRSAPGDRRHSASARSAAGPRSAAPDP